MSSNTTLRNLLRDLEKYADYADGKIDETELPVEVLWIGSGKPRPNGDPPAYLIVPGKMSLARWEATGADPAAIAATRESLQAYNLSLGLVPPRPEPEPAKETPTQSRKTRPKHDNPITAVLKSLAGTRKLRR